jgi:hypothetical protein
MDRFGVDCSVVIPFSVVEDYRTTHDEIGRAVAAHPDDGLVQPVSIPSFRSKRFVTRFGDALKLWVSAG